MTQTNYIVYHDSCMDGFLAAMLTHYKAVYDGISNIVMVPAHYGDNLPKNIKKGDTVTIVDFSYSTKIISDIIAEGVLVTVVDHHKTFIDDVMCVTNSKEAFEKSTIYTEFCTCGTDNFSLFSKKIESANKVSGFIGELVLYLSDNDNPKKSNHHKRSGAGLCSLLLHKEKNFNDFLIRFAGKDIEKTIALAEIHDLWLHNGENEHDATYLSFWFKDWYKKVEAIRKRLLADHSQSNNDFIMLKTLFNMISLEDKLIQGKQLVERKLKKIRELCKEAIEVKFSAIDIDSKVGFIPGDLPAKFGISMTGSVLVKEFGYDVAIMEAKVNNEHIVYSLRSDQYGKNIDVSALCKKLKDLGIAITGGGHRNAAGVTFPYDPLNVKLTDKSDKFFIPV